MSVHNVSSVFISRGFDGSPVIGAAVFLLRLTLVEAEARACPRPEDAARTEEPARQHVLPRVLNRRTECLRLQGTASDNVAHHRPDTGTRRL